VVGEEGRMIRGSRLKPLLQFKVGAELIVACRSGFSREPLNRDPFSISTTAIQ